MENLFKGWEYINALLTILQEKNSTGLIAPKYIYRGITQRHFTSSSFIKEYLEKYPDEANTIKKRLYKKYLKKNRIDKLNDITIQTAYYKELYWNQYDDFKKVKPNVEALRSIIDHPRFQCLKPEYIRSGAAVRLSMLKERTQADYLYYLNDMISEIRRRYPNFKENKELDVLAEIQHKGGASCLVDFSTNFLVALWFATQDYSSKERNMGFLFCYDINTDLFVNNNIAIVNPLEEDSIDELLYQTQKSIKYNGRDDYKFLIWKPSNINNRIIRQDSIFVFGIEQFRIAEHPIITLPIPFEWKESIQQTLKHLFGISSETIYADASGYASSNTKLDSCKISTSYFNFNDPDFIDLSFGMIDSFQRGISCIIKKQHDLALKYIYSFESRNFDKLSLLSKNVDTTNNTLFYIEYVYSKALCYHRLGNYSEAASNYKIAFEHCIAFVRKVQYLELKIPSEFQSLTDSEKKALHGTNKLYKIVDDYIDSLFILHQYNDAYNVILRIFNLEGPEQEVKLLIKTALNEVRLLNFIYNGEILPKIAFKENDYEDSRFYLFCKLLDELFDKIIELKLEPSYLENTKWVNTTRAILDNRIKDIKSKSSILCKKGVHNSLYSLWFMGDIISLLNNSDIETRIKSEYDLWIDKVIECQNYIEGTKSIPHY